jgi:integrase
VSGRLTTTKNTNRRRVDMSLKLAEGVEEPPARGEGRESRGGEAARDSFHDLRHTFASLLIQNGERLTYVKEQMGHSSIQVTVDVYGHLAPSANRPAVDRLDAQPIRNR